MTGMRIDKWLWAARFFKTRSLAARACELGRIDANRQTCKASREVRAGDLLRVKNEQGEFQVEVLALSEVAICPVLKPARPLLMRVRLCAWVTELVGGGAGADGRG
jgi:ribosomal 50S subunit-recycling heat shock protein